MKLDELLTTIDEVASKNNISQPFIVGGIPRDRIIGRNETSQIRDVDITTGDKGSIKLAKILNRVIPDSQYRVYDDGHSSLDVRGLHIDFSSHFIAPGVKEELERMNIKDIDDMKLEIYSRDFTMNTLLESLDFKNIYDITAEGVQDIESKIIRCPINPEITISVDPRRILRAIKFSIKYGFEIDDGLKTAMINNRKKIQTLPTKFVQSKVNEIILMDDEAGIDSLIKYKILPLVPMTKTLSDMLIQKRKLVRAL
jgi:tRNA nucleotidyltransferase (CCA-adding enzyme)